jgi:hypothetical protein
MENLAAMYPERLLNKRLVDVIGDGNCFYRAISRIKYGHENSWGPLKTAGAFNAVSNPGLVDVVGEGNK